MGSRRRRKTAPRPSTPSTHSTAAPSPPESPANTEDWVFRSLTPSEKPTYFGTPRRPGINVDQITPKHPEYFQKVDIIMSSRYHPVSVSVFQAELLKGPNLGAREMRKLGNFKNMPDVFKKPHKSKQDADELGQGTNKSGPESDMYPVLCEALNEVIKLAGSEFVFKDVSHWAESGDIDHRPDLAMYPIHAQAAAAYTLTDEKITDSTVKKARKHLIARCAYQWMITAIEVKPSGVETGFGFKPGEPLLRDGDNAVIARAQFATYASEIMLRQHRTHLFLFYIAGSNARIFRWDRNGAVVSHPINLVTDFKQLLNLVYRLARADSPLQGYDSTVALAKDGEIAKLRNHRPENQYLENYKALILDNMIEHPIYKVECDEVLDPNGRRKTRASRRKQFLIGNCVSGGYQPVGRCTKAWVCYCLDDDKMLFMKEQWRANAVGVHPEIETYLRLRKHGVRYVATVVAGGDVVDLHDSQRTVSQRFFDKGGIVMPERIHTRLVIKEVGRPLESYEFSGDLIVVVHEALIGHQQAWEKAGVLHRDVSVGNILIDTAISDYPQGFLIDWDLCKYKEELDTQTGPSQTGISGTWAFGSALSLQYPRKPKELADDLESFVHIPTYCALRWHKHQLSSLNIDNLIHATQEQQEKANRKNRSLAIAKENFFYHEVPHSNGLSSGGEAKLGFIDRAKPPLTLLAANSPLDILLKKLFVLLNRHYETIDLDDLAHYQAEPLPPPAPQPTPSPRSGRGPGTYRMVPPSPSATPLIRSTTPRADTPSTSSERSSHSSRDSVHTRPLDDHTEILSIFSSVLKDKRGRLLNLDKYLQDKVYDQFNGNAITTQNNYKNPSTRNVTNKSGASQQIPFVEPKAATGKRKPDGSESAGSRTADSNPRPKRRLRAQPLKTPNHGMYNPAV